MQTLFSVCFLFVFVKVLDSNPLPGLKITPTEGVIPAGGFANFKISFTPKAHMSFHKKFEVVQNGKNFGLSVILCVYVCTFMHLLDFISSVLMLFKNKLLLQIITAVAYSVVFFFFLVSVLLRSIKAASQFELIHIIPLTNCWM